MHTNEATRRDLLKSLATLPVAALLLPSGSAAAQARKIVVFKGVQANRRPGMDAHVFGWAAETPQGWTGWVVDGAVSTAMRDFPGAATGTMRVVPKGTPNTINGIMNKDGIRGSTVCFEEVTSGSVMGSIVKLRGELRYAENPMIFKRGDPMTVEGNLETGEFTYTLRGGGKDNVFKMKGQILTS
ncbi:MAG: hypothetical protein ACE5MM_08690 [Nitrospiraceae bacterium]